MWCHVPCCGVLPGQDMFFDLGRQCMHSGSCWLLAKKAEEWRMNMKWPSNVLFILLSDITSWVWCAFRLHSIVYPDAYYTGKKFWTSENVLRKKSAVEDTLFGGRLKICIFRVEQRHKFLLGQLARQPVNCPTGRVTDSSYLRSHKPLQPTNRWLQQHFCQLYQIHSV